MNNKKNIGCLIGLIIVVLIIAGLIGLYIWKGPPATFTAKGAYDKALEYIESQNKEALLVSLVNGYVPESVGRVSDYETTGKAANWDFCFYLEKEKDWIKLSTSGWKGEIKEDEDALSCVRKEKIDIEKWKIDSEQAIEIAKSKTEEEGKKRFVPIEIKFYQSKEGATWSIVFFPPQVGKDTVGFNVYINGETGEVIRTDEPAYHYLVI